MSGRANRRSRLTKLLPPGSEASEASTCAQAEALAASNPPNCFIVDLATRNCEKSNLVGTLARSGAAVVVVADPGNERRAADALKSGAHDYLLNSNLSAETIERAIRFANDIKMSRDRVEAAEKRYRDVFEDAPIMYVIARGEGDDAVIVDCNKAFLNAVGYAHDQVMGRSLSEFFDFVDTDGTRARGDRSIGPDGLPTECDLSGKDGRTIRVLVRLTSERIDGEQRTRATLVDISDRMEAEQALKESESRTRALLDALPDILFRLEDRAGRLTFAPTRKASVFDEELERPVESAHRELPAGVEREFERHLEMAAHFNRPVTFEYRLEVDGQSRSLEARLVASGDRSGVAIIRDLTAQKELEGQLRQAQRLEAVGRLAAGIAHDFNNILTVISGYAELSLADSSDDDENTESFGEILGASKRACDLTRQLLVFSRKQMLQPKPLDLNSLVSGLEKMLRRVIGEDVELVTDLDPEIGTIRADAGQIEQILMNLAVNARDAMPQGGELEFRTDISEFYETYIGEETKIPSGAYVRLTVTDTGEGMDEDTRSHIFEPFFTTKAKSEGTGLGLSTVYGIVKQSGGYIFVYSEPGVGTVFKMYFPLTEAEQIAEPVKQEPTEVGGHETILLVEDDTRVLTFAASVLEREGYTVIRAETGEEALGIAGVYSRDIHLVATDVVMPGMSGRELAKHLKPLGKDLRVLYMSGYNDIAGKRHGPLEMGTRFLEKPYTREPLLRAVREALDSSH